MGDEKSVSSSNLKNNQPQNMYASVLKASEPIPEPEKHTPYRALGTAASVSPVGLACLLISCVPRPSIFFFVCIGGAETTHLLQIREHR
jgi:hypothetical protein